MTDGEYEFNEKEEAVVRALAQQMRRFSVFLVLVAVLMTLTGALSFPIGMVNILVGASTFVLAYLTRRAARAFELIVETRGTDMTHLMLALRSLTRLYALKILVHVLLGAFLLAVSLILLVLLFQTF